MEKGLVSGLVIPYVLITLKFSTVKSPNKPSAPVTLPLTLVRDFSFSKTVSASGVPDRECLRLLYSIGVRKSPFPASDNRRKYPPQPRRGACFRIKASARFPSAIFRSSIVFFVRQYDKVGLPSSEGFDITQRHSLHTLSGLKSVKLRCGAALLRLYL
jgi:hypothetical protein